MITYVTPGEYTVLCKMLANGESNKRIASQMHLSEETVKTHLRKVFAKVSRDHPGIAQVDRTSLAVHALRGHIVIKPDTARFPLASVEPAEAS